MKMFRFFIGITSLLFISQIQAQSVMFTAEEKAAMYHVVAQSKSLNRNLGDLFDYKGDTIFFVYKVGGGQLDSVVDYDSIEQKIIYEPALLQVNFNELSYLESGLLSELATKMALQVTYRELKRRKETKNEGISDSVYVRFNRLLSQKLPDKAVRIKNKKRTPIPKIDDLLDPNLIFRERVKMLKELPGFKLVEQKKVLDVLNESIRFYIQQKSYEFFRKLGGESGVYNSSLLAVGDGSGTAGLLYERELLRKGKKSGKLGESKGVGLFTYESEIKSGEKNVQFISAKQSSLQEFKGIKKGYTNVHFSMYGFNSRQQSTVIITREGNAYLLYASKISKELTPDTTFGKGQTIHSNIEKLEFVSIPGVDEEINGKTGIKYWIKKYEEDLADNKLEIKETEFDLDENRYSLNKNQKKIKFLQERLSNLYNRKPQIVKNLNEAREHLRIEEERLQRFRYRLDELKGFLGDYKYDYTQFGYVFTFEDGCTFNTYTQDFKFPDSLKVEDFEVRVLSIGPDAMTERVDEVQLEITVTKGGPEDKLHNDYFLEFEDVFASDKFELKKFSLNPTDDYELAKLLHNMYVHQGDFTTSLMGNGIGKMVNHEITSSTQKDIDAYPGESEEEKLAARESDEFKMLRFAKLDLIWKDNSLKLSVNSYTDPVKSNFSKKDIRVKPLKEQYSSLSENDYLSAFRTFYITEKFFGELIRSAYFNFNGKEKSKLLSVLKKGMEKVNVEVKSTSISYSEYASIMHKEVDYYTILMDKFEKEKEVEKAKLEL